MVELMMIEWRRCGRLGLQSGDIMVRKERRHEKRKRDLPIVDVAT